MKSKLKFNIILYIIVLVAVLIMFLGIAYTYYIKVIKVKNVDINIENYNLLIEYNNGSKIIENKLFSKFEKEYSFSITNDSSDTIGNYKLTFEIITPFENMINNNFVFTLDGKSLSDDSTNKVVINNETPIPVGNKVLGEAVITPSNTHEYKLTLKMLEDKYPKNYFNDKMFVARIKVNTISN